MKSIRIAVLFAMVQLNAAAAEHYLIRLAISIDEAPFRERVQSLLSRELRKLGDVEVSDQEQPQTDLTLGVTGFRTNLKDGTDTGFALSVIVTRRFPLSLDPSEKWAQQLFGKQPLQILESRLYDDAPANIEQTCTGIVAHFDVEQLDYMRKMYILPRSVFISPPAAPVKP